ncbi:hypothetical protein WR164_15770 [Philodulcilactobacillus myokoensis]|uniref:Uncharacterized protein n=1 Tax=Philodulcilactobacillus myokoensis TaxID=2929573 RepID=A0A9W6B375_9LACO|nr:hypothetical protein WR164_15770 [Philodulcilactobacillus myokoensis]
MKTSFNVFSTIGFIFWIVIYIIVALFLWIRRMDGSGVINTLPYRMISLSIWTTFMVFILIIGLITFFVIRHYLNK